MGPSSARATQGQRFHFHRIRKKGKCKNQGGHQFPTFSASLTLNSQSLGCSTEGWVGMGGCGRAWQVWQVEVFLRSISSCLLVTHGAEVGCLGVSRGWAAAGKEKETLEARLV